MEHQPGHPRRPDHSAVERRPPQLLFLWSVGCIDCVSGGFRKSPMTPFRGQAETAGHFLQPTARAIGQRVISVSPSNDGAQPRANDSMAVLGHPTSFPVQRYARRTSSKGGLMTYPRNHVDCGTTARLVGNHSPRNASGDYVALSKAAGLSLGRNGDADHAAVPVDHRSAA